jgi:hypothetical protein
LAQAQKKSFSSELPHDVNLQTPATDALANSPIAFWSNMAEMQRRFFTTLASNAGDKAATNGANVSEIRPNAMAAPAAAMSQNWIAAATECQRELATFVNDRLSKNQAFISSAIAAPGVNELVQLQMAWMTQTAQDYTGELGKLSDIVKNGADEAIATTA